MANLTVNVTHVRQYRNKNGHTVFVYQVSGNAEAKARYQELQGSYYRPDENGQPLWFTTKFIGPKGSLILTDNDKVVPDLSKYEQAASLVSQFDGVFGDKLADRLVANIIGNKQPAGAALTDPNTITDPEMDI